MMHLGQDAGEHRCHGYQLCHGNQLYHRLSRTKTSYFSYSRFRQKTADLLCFYTKKKKKGDK